MNKDTCEWIKVPVSAYSKQTKTCDQINNLKELQIWNFISSTQRMNLLLCMTVLALSMIEIKEYGKISTYSAHD